MLNHHTIELIDLIALGWFLLCWVVYTQVEHRRPGLAREVNAWRKAWALNMLKRSNRMVDIQAINALLSNVTFFASTTILILAGLFAMLGSVMQGIEIFAALPFLETMSPATWVLKAATLIGLFIYAFFKFGWAIKQHTISAVVMASIPEPEYADELETQQNALRMARLSGLGAKHFNDGIRAYYFALAAIGWYINAWVFMLATVWVMMVLFRREYRSRAHQLLTGEHLLEDDMP